MYYANKVTLIGNTAKEITLETTKGGKKFAKVVVATNSFGKDEKGEKVSYSEFHDITIWGEKAEKTAELPKGSYVIVEGSLSYNFVEKRKFTNITATKIALLEKGKKTETPEEKA